MKTQVKRAIALVGLLMAAALVYTGQSESPAEGSHFKIVADSNSPLLRSEIGWP
ncbi:MULTISPECIES: hypothetical protein [unclassified Streptomyces]|uniref:hypothetical protein n=1 Tax=unclassified Streptomyces TaxID=2593676 RepID=UPI002E151784|nr:MULTISPECIES: hypothetical protein [unclassified Streptomyces]WSR22530.1 hypothetical protein OG573_27650 [Streptomyces sp. NBC_01205]